MLTAETPLALGITKPLPKLGRPPSRPNPRPASTGGVDPDGRCPVPLDRLLTLETVDEHRSTGCVHYEACLSEMAPNISFSCKLCQHHGKSTTDAELVTLASRRGGGNTP